MKVDRSHGPDARIPLKRMGPEEARRLALVRFGGVERAMELQREARGLWVLDVLRQDATVRLPALSSLGWLWRLARTSRSSAW
jgi:hypothetical protein